MSAGRYPTAFAYLSFGAAVLFAGALWVGAAAASGLELLMFERDGCIYCARWHEEIGPAYPRTAEGAAAPLRQIDITAPLPEGVTLTGRKPVFTPTFVLLRDGTETGRIEGYMSDEFFWPVLNGMLTRAGWNADDAQPDNPADRDSDGAIRP